MSGEKRQDGKKAGAARERAGARRIFSTMTAAGASVYARSRDLPRLIALWPHELADESLEGCKLVLAKLRQALRAERRRATSGHWSYDLNRHLGLVSAYKGELARLKAIRRNSAELRPSSHQPDLWLGAGIVQRALDLAPRGLGRPDHVVAQDPVDLSAILRQRKSHPKQYDMVTPGGRAAHHAVQRLPGLHDSAMNPAPIVGAIPGKHLVDPLAGDLLPIDVAKPRPGEPERGPLDAVPDIDQAEMGKEPRDFEGIEVRPCRHPPRARRAKPIIEELTLSLHHQLCSKGASGHHRHPPAARLQAPRITAT